MIVTNVLNGMKKPEKHGLSVKKRSVNIAVSKIIGIFALRFV